ncbi:hypothetical protein EBB07_19515 [Paenibacillaceae bacterium]|nr:hypothetical protein EBB07_19515 [Paenibacillaceae bacterium]
MWTYVDKPKHTAAPALGFPSRDPELDVYPGFVSPPKGYGEVAFYWWVGEPLTKERLEWQLAQLKDHHITALQINYAHTDEGGDLWGDTMTSDPPLFSEAWWKLFAWFAEKAGTYGISVSLSDYTLCSPGQGWYTDEILNKRPDVGGQNLFHMEWQATEGLIELALPTGTLAVTAYRWSETGGSYGEWKNLFSHIEGQMLRWTKPDGDWRIVAVYAERKRRSLDPMHPESATLVIEHFFQRFEDRLAGMPNAKLGFFFSDELEFGIRGRLWNDSFRSEFIRRKGYDLVPELPLLFVDIDPRAPKIRMDYGDVLVTLSEEHYFEPVYLWHEQRGMIYGCDHGGRGKDVTEFGDYFRTQRWNQGPGCDQPFFECDLIKNKVASSIAHLYERPRTWLEGFHSTGWGTNTSDLTDAIFRNFVSGHNLLTLHGLYYTTYGGWWEWAPPCNHFRMPYWQHMEPLLACTERLSYLLSHGVHVCDVAILYPVEAMEAGMDGHDSVMSAFGIGEYLYKRGIDLDYMDFQSVNRATIVNRELRVAAKAYRVLVIPSMRALRYSTLQKALQFYEEGGLVIALNLLPEASDRFGANDPELDAIVRTMFGWTATEAGLTAEKRINPSPTGGLAITARSFEEAAEAINLAFPRDFSCDMAIDDQTFPYVMNRRLGNRNIYAIYNVPAGTECFFRSHGDIELWSPWDASVTSVEAAKITPDGTFIQMPLERTELQLIVFTSGPNQSDESGYTNLQVNAAASHTTVELEGPWRFDLRPTLDNRFGDFRQPPEPIYLGAEARQFRHALESSKTSELWSSPAFDDTSWPKVTYGYGTYFWKLGPLPEEACTAELERRLLSLAGAPAGQSMVADGCSYSWQPYDFSMRYGMEGDPGHQGYHGLKGKMNDDFLAVGVKRFNHSDTLYDAEEAGNVSYFWSSIESKGEGQVALRPGMNTVLLRYDQPGRGHVMFEQTTAVGWKQPLPLAMSWYYNPEVFSYDAFPVESRPKAGWYRFTAPPGLEAMNISAHGSLQIWVDGAPWQVEVTGTGEEGSTAYRVSAPTRKSAVSHVAVRIAYDRTKFGGAALPEPIKLHCGEGEMELGDWSAIDGLTCYSGGASYRRQFQWSHGLSTQGRKVTLELGSLSSSAEISVNGHAIRTLVAPPWTVDITPWLRSGDNSIEVRVYNTLANHYVTIPSRYQGDLTSGLLGPVRLRIQEVYMETPN